MARAAVVGLGMTPFGKHKERSVEDLGVQAVEEALADSGIDRGLIDTTYSSNVLGGGGVGQRVLEKTGMLGHAVVNVENACASGSTAVHLARQAVESGSADAVLVLGVEKLTGMFQGGISLGRTDRPTQIGLTMPAVYALWAHRYANVYGISPDELANVAVKNRAYGARNPLAMFQKEVSVAEVLESKLIADPLTLLQCCANSDGGAALVIVREELLGSTTREPVWILGSALSSGRPVGPDTDLARSKVSRASGARAYAAAGIKPGDVDIAEIHDAFTIGEVISTEALDLAPEGTALRRDKGAVPINVSGGLLSKGHPVGATGVAQVVEIARHLRGEAGERQVSGASVGIAHTVGGGVATLEAIASGVVVLGA
jgi:acetyl-CoA acetyltransferase